MRTRTKQQPFLMRAATTALALAQATRRATAALAIILLTATTAWAQTPSGNWDTWVSDNNIDWKNAEAKAAAIPQSDDGSTVYISTAEQLAYYAWAVNNDKQTSGSAGSYYCSRTVELMADIDLSAHYWTPIGTNKNYYFNGFFHGNGHVISGMNIVLSSADGSLNTSDNFGNPCIGLFGHIRGRSYGTGTTSITDLTLKDFSVNITFNGTNPIYVGGLVGFCNNNSTTTSITNCCLINGTVSCDLVQKLSIGGLVASGTPTTCANNYRYNVSTTARGGNKVYGPISGESVANCATLTISSTHGSVAIGGSVGVITDGKIYAASGETVTLSDTPEAGYMVGYTANGVTITDGAFTMPAADIAVAATFTPDPAQFSQSGDTYTIHTAGGWNVFCDALQDNDTYNRFSGKTVRLADDITVTRMAGSGDNPFCGTFDGGGHTLTFNYANTDNNTRTAPFSYVDGATIQNLIVGGTISGTAYRAAGIIGETGNTTSHITNCVSSVDISSGRYTGGFSIGGNVEIEGCVFNGKIKGTDKSGGFIGYSYSAQVIKNSLFAPQDGSSISGGTFYYNGGGDVAPVNSYYTQALGTAQGKACHSVTAGTDVTIGAIALTGTATQYTVSGITAYSGGGLQRGQTLYYGSDDQLSLTLTTSAQCDQPGYQYAYTASAGTLSGSTLTMPDQDVTISVNTATLALIDWATVSDGDSEEDPYMIYNKDQLLLLAHRVNGTSGETANDYKGKYFKLGADITFSHDADEGDDYDENYEAIGSGFRYFRGNFDGDNHTVSGIRIRKTGTGIANNYIGLFGQTGSANIHDVHLTDARIKGYSYVGGIVGYNSDRTTVSGCTVTDSYITATTTNSNYYGIICGYNNTGFYGGHLTNNYYHGCTVNGTAVTSGMGCGGSDLDDEDNNHGAVPGYFITLGENLSIASGATTFVIPAHGETAAVTYHVATEGAQVTLSYTGTIGDGYQLGIVSNDGTADHTVSPDGDGKYIFTMPAADVTAKVDAIPWAGTGDKDDPYLIEFPSQLDLLAHRVNGTHGETANDYENKYFKLGADIIYNPDELTIDKDNDGTNDINYEAIGGTYNGTDRYFNGNFDGGGHTVSGIRIYSGGTFAYSCQGLFGTTGSSANIHDVTLADADITGGFYTGGIVGENNGTVSNCHVTASVAIHTVQDNVWNHGGIVGRNHTSGTVTHCTSAATLTIADGVTDCQYYGGIAGVNEGSLTDNLATGAVVPAAAYNTYGAISGVKDGTLQHNYYTACTVANVKNATGVGCGGIYDGGDYTVADITDDDGAVPALRDNADNTKAIALLAALASTTDNHTPVDLGWGEGQFPLQLVGRTLYKDDAWNTLCLPFDVTIADSPLDGAEVKTLTGSAFAGGKLALNFSTTSETTLTAGKPYLVRWTKPDDYVAYDGTNAAECSDLVCPVFNGVTVSTATDNVETDCVDFIGTLSPTVLYEDGAEKTNLYMGADNKLYYPTVEGFKLNACRGYFKLKGVVVNGNGNDNGNKNAVRSFDINFGDDATGIVEMRDEKGEMRNGYGYEDGGWYTVDGRRLDGKPAQKGLYIHGGRKVVIK